MFPHYWTIVEDIIGNSWGPSHGRNDIELNFLFVVNHYQLLSKQQRCRWVRHHVLLGAKAMQDTAYDIRGLWLSNNYTPLPWATVHWLVQCTLESHWNATGWPSVLWDTIGQPIEYFKAHWNTTWNYSTLESHWRNSDYCSLHWDTTGGTIIAHTQTHIVKQSKSLKI